MLADKARSAYRRTEAGGGIRPVKLIHMMYERVLLHLTYAEEGVTENNPRKRGENLGKAIALITELSAAVSPEDKSEAAVFLRGLYNSILMELPKVSTSGDTSILRQAARYIGELKKIWEETAMREQGLEPSPTRAERRMQPSPEARGAMAPLSVSI